MPDKKPQYHVVMFSGGKDSTAVLLRMMEQGCRIDEVLCCDTTMEFPGMVNHIAMVRHIVEAKGIKFTMLKAERDFEYYLLEYTPKTRRNLDLPDREGLSWPDAKTRWCTSTLKRNLIRSYIGQLKKRYEVIQYDGLAADEPKRLERKDNLHRRHPLVEWGWAEADALAYCYSKGYDWEGLYELFPRVSCWCCPLQSLEELRKLRKHFPDLWERLKALDAETWRDFRPDGWGPAALEKRFDFEAELTASGYSIRDRQFYTDVRRHCYEGVPVETILAEREEKSK